MGDHTEAISIDFDPRVISYEKLLAYFWNGHSCSSVNSNTQYMNAVFYRNDTQHAIAKKSLSEHITKLRINTANVQTKILPANTFTYAERYHQKYYLRRSGDIRTFLEEQYLDAKSLADSTVATRLNAYLGSGARRNWSDFRKELPSYGLPENLEQKVRKIADKKR